MGGNSSKATVQAAPVGDEDGERGRSRSQGPIHALCVLGEDSILSGGTDKVERLFQSLLWHNMLLFQVVNLYSWKHGRYLARFPGPGKDVTKVSGGGSF